MFLMKKLREPVRQNFCDDLQEDRHRSNDTLAHAHVWTTGNQQARLPCIVTHVMVWYDTIEGMRRYRDDMVMSTTEAEKSSHQNIIQSVKLDEKISYPTRNFSICNASHCLILFTNRILQVVEVVGNLHRTPQIHHQSLSQKICDDDLRKHSSS